VGKYSIQRWIGLESTKSSVIQAIQQKDVLVKAFSNYQMTYMQTILHKNYAIPFGKINTPIFKKD
jgi:hypothetical protein